MTKKDIKTQKQLVDEMMKVSKTNPDVMIYMQALMQKYEELEQEIDRLNNIIDELEKYIGQEWYCFDNESVEHHVAWHILMKLKELKGDENEN